MRVETRASERTYPLGERRILLVTPTSPWDGSFGAQQRTALIYDALRDLRPVDVLLLAEGDADRVAPGRRPETLAEISWKQSPLALYKYATNRRVSRWCDTHLDWSRYLLGVGRYFTTMTKIRWPSHVRTLVDCDDAFYRYVPRTEAALARAAAAARGTLRVWQTKATIGRYDHAFLSCRRDRELFGSFESSLLPNVVAPIPGGRVRAEGLQDRLLIVGSLWYAPNRNGVEWFLGQCWPAIAARCPKLTLRLVGAAPPDVRARWSRNVRTEAPGFVDDLAAEYARALFTVAPVHYGGGTCIKFLESAAFGTPSVITTHVHSGFDDDFKDGQSTLVANDPADMVRSCIALAEDPALRQAIAAHARSIAAERYTVERFRAVVQRAASALLA